MKEDTFTLTCTFGPPHIYKPQVITCDIDSTIADTRHRWHMVKDNPDPDWLAYALASENDSPANIENLKNLRFWGDIIFVSSRPEGSRNVTLKWLNKLGVPYLALVLDDEEMGLGDFKVKAIRDIMEVYDVRFHIDDRQEVKQAVERDLGIYVHLWSAYND